jgi:MFS family permease
MIVISFTVGLLSVTSYNIRMSSTQIYIPNHMRGRVNASQNLLWNLGAILGALIMGAIAEYSSLDYRLIMLFAAIVSLTAIIFIPIRMKDEFKKVYNADI